MKTYSLKPSLQDVVGQDQLREQVRAQAQQFKACWVGLAKTLYPIWKDKLYLSWGFENFDEYTGKELKIRRNTAMKLIGSYSFLEKESPKSLEDEEKVPSYETVEALRRLQRTQVASPGEFEQIKKEVLSGERDKSDFKKDVAMMIRQRKDTPPVGAQDSFRRKQLSSALVTFEKQLRLLEGLPNSLLKKAQEVFLEIENYLKDKE